MWKPNHPTKKSKLSKSSATPTAPSQFTQPQNYQVAAKTNTPQKMYKNNTPNPFRQRLGDNWIKKLIVIIVIMITIILVLKMLGIDYNDSIPNPPENN